jgi:hypothetical protein
MLDFLGKIGDISFALFAPADRAHLGRKRNRPAPHKRRVSLWMFRLDARQ